MDNKMLSEALISMLGAGNVRTGELMKTHTTFRIGGVADYYVTPQAEKQIADVIAFLKKSDIITLGQFADAMKRAYGEQVLRNADFFSFFVNLCQKDEYQLGGDAGEDTFLDAYLGEGFKDTESFTFAIRKGIGGQVILSDNCMMADVELVRKEAHGE